MLQAGRFKVCVRVPLWSEQFTVRCSDSFSCGKCFGAHATATCTEDWVCRRCKGSGHKMIDYPVSESEPQPGPGDQVNTTSKTVDEEPVTMGAKTAPV